MRPRFSDGAPLEKFIRGGRVRTYDLDDVIPHRLADQLGFQCLDVPIMLESARKRDATLLPLLYREGFFELTNVIAL